MAVSREVKPPVARKVRKEISIHGDTLVDDYYWMRDRSNPGVIEYIEAENRYTDQMMRHTEPLQKKLLDEFKGRIPEEDISVPVKRGDFYYYVRFEKGKQYAIHCRKKGNLQAQEEVILDINRLAEGNEFFNVDVVKPSPDNRYLAYLADVDGSERHTVFVKDLQSGQLLPETMKKAQDIEWANDSRTFFYTVLDDEFRPYKVFRHVLGTDPKEDVEVFHEEDKSYYYMLLQKTKSKKFITITVESATTSEVRYVSADNPKEPFKVFAPRKHTVEYFLRHHVDRWFVITNEDAKNFKIMETPVANSSRENWKEFIPHSESVCIDVSDPVPYVEVFKEHMAIFEREGGVQRIRIVDLLTKESHTIDLPEELRTLAPDENPDFESHVLRFRYSSFVTPTTVYDYDMRTRKLILKKQDVVPGHDSSRYVTERIWAEAADGTKIPISLIYRKGLQKDGNNPCYLYAYGAYGDFSGASPKFNQHWLSLLDRGFVCALAHIRGGGDLGRAWHEQGRVLTKRNSFTDFIACAEHLIEQGYTSKEKLAIRGRSAGGLLMGSVVTMRPDLFKAVVAEVPFVDAVMTMLDDTIPLTASEFEEWGDPRIKEHYEYIKSYSPYDNIRRTAYPDMLVTSGWNDSRVQYWEPTKFVAKLRANKTDDNLLLLRTNIVQGHMGASGRLDSLRYYAFMYAFVLDRLGMKD